MADFHDHRARRSGIALAAYSAETGSDMPDDAITDVIADLGHYADHHALDFPLLLRRAIGHWLAEKSDPEGLDHPEIAILADGQDLTVRP